jgi:hypothetical protein
VYTLTGLQRLKNIACIASQDSAKLDRACIAQTHTHTQGIATFTPAKDPNDTLNAWSNNISELLGKVEKMCHLIHKENMVHGVRK